MIPAGENPDLVRRNLVDEAVLLIYASRPAAGQNALERFGLPDTFERVSLHVFDEGDDAQRLVSILLDPPG
jgi:hypothetical protein